MKTIFSCVVDAQIRYQIQAMLWATSLITFAKVQPANIFIHHIGSARKELLSWAAGKGIRLIKVLPFEPHHPYCNKLQQLDTFDSLNADYICMMDSDTVVLHPIDRLKLATGESVVPSGAIYAKVVDFPNPSFEILRKVFQKAGFQELDPVQTDFAIDDQNQTDRNNFNGGFYFLTPSFCWKLKPLWRKWANWCLVNNELFVAYQMHIDQVSLALALREIGICGTLIDLSMNLPLHVPEVVPNIDPVVLHYHDRMDSMLKLLPCGKPLVDHQISKVNSAIDDFIRDELPIRMFWSIRYELFPDTGSGVGSRGEFVELKRQMIECLTFGSQNDSILDVGCGDLEIMQSLNFRDYTGIDIASSALSLAKRKRPDWRFMHGSGSDLLDASFDIVICLDVLIHQKDKKSYQNLLKNLIRLTRRRLIVSGYETTPENRSAIVRYFGPLSEHINETGQFSEIMVTNQYRDVSVVCADKKPTDRPAHPRDLLPSQLHLGYPYAERRDLLRLLVDASRKYLGFFPSHATRMIEYPWILEQIVNLKEKGRILDVGAGLNPLPFCIKLMGCEMETVDNHTLVRNYEDKNNWNEWGFLDYGQLLPGILSHQLNITDLYRNIPFDVIYSVSVLEHMTAKMRGQTFASFHRLLRCGGNLFITLDIVPATSMLWNRCEGLRVEEPTIHGDARMILQELEGNDFSINNHFFRRRLYGAQTDLMFIEATRR